MGNIRPHPTVSADSMKVISIAAWSCLVALAPAQDYWEQQPFRYSETQPNDPAGALSKKLEADGYATKSTAPLDRVREILASLHISETSQILVFSKTSKQNDIINPANPRALYYSEDAYAAFVPGGQMEIITHDPMLGPVYRIVSLGDERPEMIRETGDCLVCHGTARTSNVPGVFVRSIFPDTDGLPLLSHGGYQVDSTTPLPQRWGGYYVTGHSSLSHLGNRFFRADTEPPRFTQPLNVKTLVGKIDTTKYPRATSDIVALMVLEHQCQVDNLITSAAYHYRRAAWMATTLDPAAKPDEGTAGRLADEDAAALVDALLFKDAAPMGEGVEGDRAFQDQFEKRFPISSDGRSLAQFHLGSKLFKHRCSYMIYSKSFEALPPRVKSAVVARLRLILEGPEKMKEYAYISASEKRRIAGILKETWPIYQPGGI